MKNNTREEKTYIFTSLDDINSDMFKKAYNDNDDINVDYEWHDCNEVDFETILELLGFYDIETYFSGFSSQGDGASFTAKWLRNARLANKIEDYAPRDKELHQIAKNLMEYPVGTQGSVDRTRFTNYYHSNTMTAELDSDTPDKYTEDILETNARYLADWYYSSLKREYEYRTSKESVLETFIENEYEFNEQGRLL